MNNSTIFKAEFSTNSTPSTHVPRDLAIFVITFVAINILVAAIGNAYVLILLRSRQDFRKVPHCLLGNLSLTGLMSALFSMPLLIAMTTVNYFETRVDFSVFEVLCKLGFSSGSPFRILNDLTMSLMAFDRQDCVLRPFSRRLTRSKVKKIIPVTWIFSLTAALFAFLIRNQQSECIMLHSGYSHVTSHRNVRLLLNVIAAVCQLSTITIVFIIVTFFRIVKTLRSSTVTPSKSAHQRQEKKLTRLTYKICAMYLLFRGPVIICHLVSKIGAFYGTTMNTVTLVSVTLGNLMYVANPLLHHKMLKIRAPRNQQLRETEPAKPTTTAHCVSTASVSAVELTRFVRINP